MIGRLVRSMKVKALRWQIALAISALLWLPQTACFRGAGLLAAAVVGTAIITAAVVSSTPPPPPRVIYVPEPRQGQAWQPGYWTLQNNQWVWVDGHWVVLQPGYNWSPTHWEQSPDGSWRLVPGQWVPVGAPLPPQSYPSAPPPPPAGRY